MEKEINKPKKGLWDSLSTDNVDKKPKVQFDVNITKRVIFLSEPKEFPSREDAESVFYVFEVEEDKIQKSISTSAWTLLHELKKLSPLTGKIADITKKLEKGKQFFKVEEVKTTK